MKNKYLRLQVVTLFMIMIMICLSCFKEDKSILHEPFDRNTRGWIEESSDYHSLSIDSGYYLIESRDTASSTYRTSTGSLDKSYLLALPDRYEIESKLKLKKYDLNDVHFGLLLKSASLEYSFNIYKSGLVEVLVYNYNSKIEYILLSDTSDYQFENELKIKIVVDNTDFRFFIEDYEIGRSKFNVKSWQDLRLFTSKQSQIAVDYLKINKLNND